MAPDKMQTLFYAVQSGRITALERPLRAAELGMDTRRACTGQHDERTRAVQRGVEHGAAIRPGG